MNYSIGIDIGGTNTEFGLVDEKGTIIQREKLKTKDFSTTDDYLKALTAKIELLADSVREENLILGVGIGAPNGNYYHGTIEYAPNLPFKGIVNLKNNLEVLLLKDGYNLKVTVTNDANAAAIGEMIYGNAKDIKDFIMITLGTGVGSGIVVDGKLVYGHTGFAGEVGHSIIDINGRQCNCGRRGCVERYASATGIVITVKEMLQNFDKPSVLRDLDFDSITSKDIYDAAVKGDCIALDCFDYTAKMLAVGIANACEITSPQKVFLFGGLSKAGNYLLTPLSKYLNEYLYSTFQNTITIELSDLKETDAALLGAAALCF